MIPVWERVVAFKQSRSPRCLIRPAIVREASLPEMRFVVAGDLMGAGPDVA
ncbi:hypothetical protein N9D23_08635 [Rubripirellula sp.]|nr:hypothetical protein [Rubripirellula sp.]